MRERFPEYFYEPNIKEMWKTAIFVPDTNVLLDIFRFPPASSEGLLKILKHLKDRDRLWIPYQFAHEYLKELPKVRQNIQDVDKKRMDDLEHLRQDVANALRKFDDQTDYELDEQITDIKDIFKAIREGLKEHRKKHKERLNTEDLKDEIDKLFADRIGDPYSDQELAEIYEKGEWRYKMRRPPGFKDENKPESQRYGDLIGWLQIIKYAENETPKRPIILVTRDSGGDDWFYKPGHDGRHHGPHPELVKEMRAKADIDFFIYQTGEFMALANKYLELDKRIDDNAIREARKREKRVLLVRQGLDMMRGALRSMQRDVDIIHKELDLIQPLGRPIMRDERPPMQPLDTPKMHEALRSIRHDVDVMRDGLRLIQHLGRSIMYEALGSIQRETSRMSSTLRSTQQDKDIIMRAALRSVQRNVHIMHDELAQYTHLTRLLDDDNTTS